MACFTFFAVGGCFGFASAAQIKSYDIEVNPTPGSIHWMNPRQLVLIGLVQADKHERSTLGFNRVGRLAIVDLDSERVSWGDAFTGRLCVNGTAIAYHTTEEIPGLGSRTRRFWLFEGTPGNMTRREVQREDLDQAALDFDYTCRRGADLPAEPAGTGGKRLKRLRPEHGFVEIETPDAFGPAYPVRFYPADRGRPVVPVDALRGVDLDLRWAWFPFRNAYWVKQAVRHYPLVPPGVYKSWWLHPDGRVTVAAEFDLARTFRVWRSWTPTIPVRVGFLALQERGRPNRIFGDIGDAGIYRFDAGGKHEKLVAGLVVSWAVSPDGCKVAVGVDDKRERTDRYFLKVLHVCKG